MEEKDNFIEVYKNTLSDKSCDFVIECFEKYKEYTHVGRVARGEHLDVKDSLDLNLLKLGKLLPEFLLDEFKEGLKKSIEKYITKYKLLDDILEMDMWKEFAIYPYGILAKRYTKGKGGFHKWHQDWGPKNDHAYRYLVCMYYLNDVEEGGETGFYHQNIKVKPTKGSLVIFPAYFTHLHKGHVPISSDKYIINFWLLRGQPPPDPNLPFKIN